LRAIIINTGQRNPPNSAAVYVHPIARERPRSSSEPSVTGACVWYLVSRDITQKWICRPQKVVNSVCYDKIVSDPRCHWPSAATKNMWVIKYLNYIL
jgi:hypothetical protein